MLADSSQFELHPDIEPLPQTVLDRLLWPLLLLLAWLAFELTANATLSVVLACLKFGMNDFRTAWWLWRKDPLRSRARACAVFYAASGAWKTSVMPLLIAVTIFIVWALVAPGAIKQGNPVTEQLVLSLHVGTCAAIILIFLAISATVLSLLAQWRVWVHPNVHRSMRQGHWPPQFSPTDRTRANYAFLILLTTIFILVVIGPVLTLLAVNFVFHPPVGVRRIVAIAVVFGYPVLGGIAFRLLRCKLFANSPWECWPESIRQLDLQGTHAVQMHQDGEEPSFIGLASSR